MSSEDQYKEMKMDTNSIVRKVVELNEYKVVDIKKYSSKK